MLGRFSLALQGFLSRGKRQADGIPLGENPARVAFSGASFGESALARARTCDSARRDVRHVREGPAMAGEVVPVRGGVPAAAQQEALEALCATRRALEELDQRLTAQVVDARQAGASWEDVAYATGYSLSYTHRRWRELCRMFDAGRSYRPVRPRAAS